jgi:hypothetical protein
MHTFSIFFLLIITVSGCSVIDNSTKFYRDRPPHYLATLQ